MQTTADINMDLPNLFTTQAQGETNFVICVILTDETVQSLLLGVSIQTTRIIKRSTIRKYSSQADAVLRTDESLQELGKESEEVNDVLFALQDSWMTDDQINDDKKSLLQKITTELSLEAKGFVLQSESLYQHYIGQHTHFSAILLIFSNQNITMLIIIQGKIQLTETVGRSNDVGADVTEALSRYINMHQGTYLPGKILCASFIHSDAELADYQQQLLDVDWSDSIPFVQQPTVDVMRSELAISLISQQAGQALAVQLGSNAQKHEKQDGEADVIDQTEPEINSGEQIQADKAAEKTDHAGTAVAGLASTAALGTSNKTQASSFGVPIKSQLLENSSEDEDEGRDDQPHLTKTSGLSMKASLGTQRTKKQYNLKLFLIAGVTAGLIAVVGIGLFFTMFMSSVTAVIVPQNLSISKEVKLTLDPEATTSDPENRVIPAGETTKSISKDVTIETTGIKIVGDKATGRVVIFNKTEADKTFPKDTVVSLGEIQFITDEEVTVPAAVIEESTSSRKTEFGEASVNVTAYLIGVEGNIEDDKELTVGDFDRDTYSALSEGNFEGGSSREVRVVAEEDLANAVQKARQEILEQANAMFAKESGNGQYILETNQIEVEEISHSSELETEADSLTTTVGATVTAITYQSADLQPIASAILASEIPDGYAISDEDPQILSTPDDGTDASEAITLTANITSIAEPVIDEQQLVEDIAGKPISEAQSILQNKNGIQTVSFVHNPKWSSQLLRTMPKNTNRIAVQKIEE